MVSLFWPTSFAQSNTYALGGLPVSAVTFGQPAALAGLQKGDVIVSVNGTSLRAAEHSRAIHLLNAAFSSNSTHVSLDVVRCSCSSPPITVSSVTLVRRCHSPIDSDVNTLLGVKNPQLMSIAITGLGGGARFFPPPAALLPPMFRAPTNRPRHRPPSPSWTPPPAACSLRVCSSLSCSWLLFAFLGRNRYLQFLCDFGGLVRPSAHRLR